MSMQELGPFLISALAVLGYLFLRVRISSLVQPVRLELAELGEDLLVQHDLTEDHRKRISFMLGSMYSSRMAWGLTFLYIPVTFHSAFQRWMKPEEKKRGPQLKDQTNRKLRRFYTTSLVAFLANSPIAFLLFSFEVIVTQIFFVPAGRSFKSAIDAVANLTERKEELLHSKHRSC